MTLSRQSAVNFAVIYNRRRPQMCPESRQDGEFHEAAGDTAVGKAVSRRQTNRARDQLHVSGVCLFNVVLIL
jgi:hypothetical protein